MSSREYKQNIKTESMKAWTDKEEFLQSIELPTYEGKYSVIPHNVFIEELQEQLDKKGMQIGSKKYLTGNKGQILTGEYGIISNIEDESQIAIGFHNSYNKQMKAGIYGGLLMLVCSNGAYSYGQNMYKRKHTGNALQELRQQMVNVIEEAEGSYVQLVAEKEAMKEKELSRQTIASLIGDMWLNEQLVNTTQIEIIRKEMLYNEHFHEKTAWSLYNWCTESIKQAHPANYIKQHLKLHTYISNKLQLSDMRKNVYGVLNEELVEA